jgi:hypothetical protein
MSQYGNEPGQTGPAGAYGSGTGSLPPTQLRRRLFGIVIVLIGILLIVLLLFIFPRPTATVTLTPASKTLSNSETVSVVAHVLSSLQQGMQTGVPSGSPAQGVHATGTLKFLNYTYSWVTIPAGTSVTSETGQQIVTDKTIRVPPDPIIPGVASVSAHAAKTGEDGNIPMMSIDKPCCVAGIFVLNESAYSGGLHDQKYPVMLQNDLNTAANALKTSLTQKALTDMQSQLKSGEQLATAISQCATNVTSTPGVGGSAAKFTVNVSLTCSDSAYNPQMPLRYAEDMLRQKAAQQLDPGFTLFGNITTRIEKVAQSEHGNVNVLVSAGGTWKYRFTAARKLDIAKHIARATIANAKTLLLQQIGVANASILISGPIIDLSGHNIIPDDLRTITING